MRSAVTMWPKSAAHNLTDSIGNRFAWLGWAACFVGAGVPAHLTRTAWWQLSEVEREDANGAASRVCRWYDGNYAQTIFDF